jgi:hypothetical protein
VLTSQGQLLQRLEFVVTGQETLAPAGVTGPDL